MIVVRVKMFAEQILFGEHFITNDEHVRGSSTNVRKRNELFANVREYINDFVK